MAMNMPTHIAAKPSQMRAIIDAQDAASKVLDFSWANECRVLRPDADPENREIGSREDQRVPR
jgi:hypothetical protein